MAYDVIVDRERGLAALYNPGTFRALGPVAAGDNAEQQLEAFVGVLEGEVTEYTPWDLMAYWDAYAATAAEQMAALQAELPAEPEGTDEPPAADGDLPPSGPQIAVIAEPDSVHSASTGAPTDEAPQWATTARCQNCQATSFHDEGAGLVCAVCGTPAPEGATATA